MFLLRIYPQRRRDLNVMLELSVWQMRETRGRGKWGKRGGKWVFVRLGFMRPHGSVMDISPFHWGRQVFRLSDAAFFGIYFCGCVSVWILVVILGLFKPW